MEESCQQLLKGPCCPPFPPTCRGSPWARPGRHWGVLTAGSRGASVQAQWVGPGTVQACLPWPPAHAPTSASWGHTGQGPRRPGALPQLGRTSGTRPELGRTRAQGRWSWGEPGCPGAPPREPGCPPGAGGETRRLGGPPAPRDGGQIRSPGAPPAPSWRTTQESWCPPQLTGPWCQLCPCPAQPGPGGGTLPLGFGAGHKGGFPPQPSTPHGPPPGTRPPGPGQGGN